MSNESKHINWPGKSGKTYTYWIYPIDFDFNDEPGNYIFAFESSPNKWTAVYVGQTSSLNDRHQSHEKEECAVQNNATHIHAHTNPDKAVRLAEEKDIALRWEPICNHLALYKNQ